VPGLIGPPGLPGPAPDLSELVSRFDKLSRRFDDLESKIENDCPAEVVGKTNQPPMVYYEIRRRK